jgi:hypothetical protein
MNARTKATPSRKDVEEAVARLFPGSDKQTILSILDEYGIRDWERERERVQLAILKLSAGDEQRLLDFTGVAKQDYRDVLMWADNPPTPEQAAADLERAKALLEKWGKPDKA